MRLLLLILTLIPIMSFGQKNFTLSGKITDNETGEDLIGVTILAVDPGIGTVTNTYGFYSLSLPEGSYTIRYTYIGYENYEQKIDLTKNFTNSIEIAPSKIILDEVIVSAEKRDKNISSAEMGVEKLSMKDIENIPVLFGEKDILKTIQLLPGISGSGEGGTGFNVRGGSSDQNLILLDEATVYSASHLMGFFSIFNADALKDVTVYKGGIPASYGGRASSVLDVTMNNGNNKEFKGSAGIGLISTRLTLEGPIIKDKMSFIVSGRRTYADLVAKALLSDEVFSDDLQLYFYDLNAKVNYTINDKNRFFISGYFGQDVFGFGEDMGTSWGNSTATVRWNHLFNNKLFSNTSAIYSKYNYGFNIGQNSMKMSSGIEAYSFKEDFSWYPNPNNTIKFGLSAMHQTFRPGELTTDETNNFELVLTEKRALESGIYIQNEQKISSRLSTNYGVRLSMFNQLGQGWIYEYGEEGSNPVDSNYYGTGEIAQSYYGFEPRLSLNYMLDMKSSVKLSYNRMAQYVHLLSNSTSGSPTDVWMPSSNNLKPTYVDQLSAGYFRNFLDNNFETSVEFYYKDIQNVADYEDGADVMLNEHVESQILSGIGRSYGIELYLKKKYGKFTGWVSYTLSRTENKIEGINNNTWYAAKHDKTHDVSIVGSYKLSPRLTVSSVWSYATSSAVTFPSGKYVIDGNQVPYYTERNGYRMPEYHRLDLSLTLKGKERKNYQGSWDFSIYNVYNRKNAYSINFGESETNPGTTEAVKLSLFGIVPSVTYNIKF